MELQKVQRTTLTMKEAAEYLGISYWLVNQLVRRKNGTTIYKLDCKESGERRICIIYNG